MKKWLALCMTVCLVITGVFNTAFASGTVSSEMYGSVIKITGTLPQNLAGEAVTVLCLKNNSFSEGNYNDFLAGDIGYINEFKSKADGTYSCSFIFKENVSQYGLLVCVDGVIVNSTINDITYQIADYDYDRSTSVVSVFGKLDAANQKVTLIVLDKDSTIENLYSASPEAIGMHLNHLDQAFTNSTGNYRITFKLNGETGNYPYYVVGPDEIYVDGVIDYYKDTEVNALVDQIRGIAKGEGLPSNKISGIRNIFMEPSNLTKLGLTDEIEAGFYAYDMPNEALEILCGPESKITSAEQLETDLKTALYKYLITVSTNATEFDEYMDNILDSSDELATLKNIYTNEIVSDSSKQEILEKIKSYVSQNSDYNYWSYISEQITLYGVNKASHYTEVERVVTTYTDAFSGITKTLADSDYLRAMDYIPYSSVNSFIGELNKTTTVQQGPSQDTQNNGDTNSGLTGTIPSPSGTGNTSEPYTPNVGSGNVFEKVYFTDLDGAAWAKDYINSLYERNIINGRGVGIYEPNSFITREEFVKILVTLETAQLPAATQVFNDIDANAWYAPYVVAAKNMSITEGDDNGNFGVGKPITREDACTMLYRYMGDRLTESDGTATEFPDKDDISEYAYKAIAVLQNAEVINGNDGGYFLPKNNITRAETAKIIYMILELI